MCTNDSCEHKGEVFTAEEAKLIKRMRQERK